LSAAFIARCRCENPTPQYGAPSRARFALHLACSY
jgi:hypothetical protein